MNAKQFRLVLALLAAAFVGYHMGSSKEEPTPVVATHEDDVRSAAPSPEPGPKPEPVAQEAAQPPFEFTRQYDMDRDVTHYTPWAQNGGYQFRPTDRDRQQARRYQPGARYDRPLNAETQNAPNQQPRGYRDRHIDRRFRPLLQPQRERTAEPREYRPMSSTYASQFVHRL